VDGMLNEYAYINLHIKRKNKKLNEIGEKI
jgi:hypothetical protein